jgi:probable addiction module antidote protein
MTDIAEATGLNRQALYKAFSSEGDPRASTLWKMLDALGIKLVPKIEKAS